jgi:hypothetical protein
VGLAVAAICAVLPVPTRAATPDRHVSSTYAAPGGTTDGTTASLLLSPALTAVATPDEDRVRITTADHSGHPVAVVVDVTPSGGAASRTIACGSLSVPVSAGTRVEVTPVTGTCPDRRLSVAGGGTLDLAFHKRPPAPPPKAPRRVVAAAADRWAVLIGISDYAGRTHSTVGGTGDVATIRTALLRAGWRDDHVLMLRDGQATGAGIRSAMDWLVARSTPRTFTLFHFSGHICVAGRGPCPEGHTWLWSHDNRFLSEGEVGSSLTRLRGHSWLDVAGCEAGAFDNGFHSKTRLFTASSRADETSYENPDRKQSVWVWLAWDRGYLGGHADKENRPLRPTMRQMAAYGARNAPEFTREGKAGPQHPVWVGGDPSWTLHAPPGAR